MQTVFIIFGILEGKKCDMLTTTIVMAMYNGTKYVLEQLDSLRSQTHQPEKVIISDDGSSDSSVELVEDYIKRYDLGGSWICRQNVKNLGYADNFWYAAREVDTDVFFFCDQDDVWKENKIETMLKVFEENELVQVLGSGYTAFTDTEESYKDIALTQVSETGELEKVNLNYKTIFIGCEGCTMAVRTAFLEEMAPYHYDCAPHDEFVWKSALCVDGCYILHESLMMRRFHANNVTHNKMHDKKTRIKFLELLLRSHIVMKQIALEHSVGKQELRIIDKNIESVKLRIDLLKRKKLENAIILAIKYHNCYHSKKAILMEEIIAIKKE